MTFQYKNVAGNAFHFPVTAIKDVILSFSHKISLSMCNRVFISPTHTSTIAGLLLEQTDRTFNTRHVV